MLQNISALSRSTSFLSTKFHNMTIFTVFNQTNVDLVSVRDFQNETKKKSYWAYTFER